MIKGRLAAVAGNTGRLAYLKAKLFSRPRQIIGGIRRVGEL